MKKVHLSFRGIHGQNLALKWLNEGFIGNTFIFFYFFLAVSAPNSLRAGAPNSLRTETRPESPAGCKPSNSTKNPTVSMNTTTGFKFLLQKIRETPIFRPSFTETAKKKKNEGFPLKTRRFFTSCLFYSLPYSLLCKCIEFPLPTILPPYPEQENLTKYSLSSQVLMFGSILPISLQQIEYEKIHAVHSSELAKSYTMKPISIFIDTLKYDLWEFNKNRPFFTVFCPYLFKKSHM